MKIILGLLLNFYLYGYDDIDNKTAFEVLMFKSGVTSLTKDFENEKENIAKNSEDIESLKKEVQYLLQENMKLKLGSQESSLEDENKLLKKEIEKLKSKLVSKKEVKQELKSDTLIAIVSDEKASSVISPFPNSKIVHYYTKGERLRIKSCNRYDWCKIKNKKEYIAKYKIYFVEE